MKIKHTANQWRKQGKVEWKKHDLGVSSKFRRKGKGPSTVSSICNRLCISRFWMAWYLVRKWPRYLGQVLSLSSGSQPCLQRIHLPRLNQDMSNQRIRSSDTMKRQRNSNFEKCRASFWEIVLQEVMLKGLEWRNAKRLPNQVQCCQNAVFDDLWHWDRLVFRLTYNSRREKKCIIKRYKNDRRGWACRMFDPSFHSE